MAQRCFSLRVRSLLVVLVLAIAGIGLRATSIIPPTFDELVDSSREVFLGRTVSRSARWIDSRDGRAIVTLVTFAIEESLKGDLQTQTSLEFLGGTVGDVTMGVADMPQFVVGDRDVLFVGNRNAVSPIVGFMYGRFRIVRDAVRGVDTVRMSNGLPLQATAAIGRPMPSSLSGVQSLSLSDFRTAILARLRAQRGRAQ
jgi:hypothetical protein